MDTYANITDYEMYFGPIEAIQTSAIDNPASLSIDADRLTRALVVASSEMDSYLSRRYDIGSLRESTPEVLKGLCLDIARYRLVIHRIPEEYTNRYNAAIARLKDFSSGKAELGGIIQSDGSIDAENSRSNHLSYASAAPRVFNRSRLRKSL